MNKGITQLNTYRYKTLYFSQREKSPSGKRHSKIETYEQLSNFAL